MISLSNILLEMPEDSFNFEEFMQRPDAEEILTDQGSFANFFGPFSSMQKSDALTAIKAHMMALVNDGGTLGQMSAKAWDYFIMNADEASFHEVMEPLLEEIKRDLKGYGYEFGCDIQTLLKNESVPGDVLAQIMQFADEVIDAEEAESLRKAVMDHPNWSEADESGLEDMNEEDYDLPWITFQWEMKKKELIKVTDDGDVKGITKKGKLAALKWLIHSYQEKGWSPSVGMVVRILSRVLNDAQDLAVLWDKVLRPDLDSRSDLELKNTFGAQWGMFNDVGDRAVAYSNMVNSKHCPSEALAYIYAMAKHYTPMRQSYYKITLQKFWNHPNFTLDVQEEKLIAQAISMSKTPSEIKKFIMGNMS